MGIKDFKLKWAHGMCRGKPVYVSNNKILIPSDFFMKTCDVTGNNIRYHFEPKIKIGCCCSLPDLGLIAVSERKPNGVIYILNYPQMSKVSVLEQVNNEPYSSLSFVGLELLISLHIKKCYEIDLWKWSSGERVYFLSIPLLPSGVLDVNLLLNPLWWYQIILKCNERLILLEVKQSDDKYVLEASSYYFSMDKENIIELSIKDEHKCQKDSHEDSTKPMLDNLIIQSVCWLPENDILVATSKGFLKVEYSNFAVYKLADNKTVVSSMVLCKSGVFVGYKTGCVDIFTIFGHRWNFVETIKIDQPINQLFLSPNFNCLTVTTLKGSIFYCKMNEKVSFNISFRSEFGGEVGVNFLGPLANLCVTAKRNGFIHIFRTIDGKVLSTFQLGEEIVSIATSPLSYCIVIGTNVGFIYFIDVTNVQKPKIVHCERPYEIPINHLKFDNFGRFLISSAQNEPIKIWNGLPSSGFALLGSKKVTTQVKDFTAFCRNQESDDTFLFTLSESGSGSDKETGNMLIRLKLPPDFISDPEKYQIDVFGTLNGDALNFQKRRLDKPCCKMDIHLTLGAIFYSSKTHKVYNYPIWSDFSNAKQDDVSPENVKSISYICVSPDQQWITVTDLYGGIFILGSKEFKISAASEKYYAAENVCKSFIDFPLSSNRLICGRENGVLLYLEWEDDSNISKNLPEWIIHCYSHFDDENNYLHSMEEEETLACILQVNEISHNEPFVLQEVFEKLEMWTFVLNFNLNKLVQEKEPNIFISNNFNYDSLGKLSLDNRRKLPVIAPEVTQAEAKIQKSDKENSTKFLSSFCSGFATQDYAKENIDSDKNLIKILGSHSEKRMKMPLNWSFCKTVKMKSKEERLATIVDLIKKICDMKTEFNSEFEGLYKMKPNVFIRADEELDSAKGITRNLPSKAERDFWGAVLIERNYGRHFVNVESIDISNENQATQIKGEEDIKEAKRSIEAYATSSLNIQKEFDSEVENLVLNKRNCDMKIYIYEVKIHSLLLFTEEEENFAKWREEVENEIKYLVELQSDINGIIKDISDLEKNVKDIYLVLQKEERKKSYKISKRCSKIDNPKALSSLKKQPALQLSEESQNPFWCSYSSIHIDLKTITKDLFVCPDESHKTEWIALCNKQVQVLKIGVVMRNLQNQLIELTSIKQSCTDTYLDLKMKQEIMQKALKYMELMISKSNMTFHSLLVTQLENLDLNRDGDPKSKSELAGLSSADTSDHNIMKNIYLEANKLIRIEEVLEEVEKFFEICNKLKLEMCLKSKCLQTGYLGKVKDLKDNLVFKKQNFTKTKHVADNILEENRKSLFNILKLSSVNRN